MHVQLRKTEIEKILIRINSCRYSDYVVILHSPMLGVGSGKAKEKKEQEDERDFSAPHSQIAYVSLAAFECRRDVYAR